MGFAFNPFTGNFDAKGSGGGGSAFFTGEVATYADLPLDGTAPLDSRWLVRTNSGTWPFSSYKQAGVYVRSAIVGASRDNDYTLTDTSFHDVMSDDAFLLFDEGDATKNLKFQLSGIATATTRTLTVPDASGTLGWLQSVSSITVSTDHQLTAARNQRVRVNSTASGSGASVYLPVTGNAEGDRLEVACAGLTAGTLSVRTGQYDFTVSTSMILDQQRTFIYASGAWTLGSVESHTHAGLGPTFASSAFRVTEGALNNTTNSLAFSLSGITAGSTRTLTVPNQNGTIALNETFASPPAIGSTTPNSGAFTTLNATGLTLTNTNTFTLNANDSFAATAYVSLDGVRLLFKTGNTARAGVSAGGDLFALSNLSVGGLIGAGATLTADGANILAERNGTNPQTFRLYNTFTDANNYERGFMRWSSNVLQIGTEAGGTGSARNLEFQTGGVTRLTLTATGLIQTRQGATFQLFASSASTHSVNLQAQNDGILRISNNANSDFSRLQFGGTTSSFPALKRSSTVLQARLADDTDFCPLQGQLRIHQNAVAETPTATHTMTIFDAAGTAYKVLCVAA